MSSKFKDNDDVLAYHKDLIFPAKVRAVTVGCSLNGFKSRRDIHLLVRVHAVAVASQR